MGSPPAEAWAVAVTRLTGEETLKLDVLGLCGWLHLHVAHFRPARTADGGWRTAVQGNGKGYPDLTIVGVTEVMWRELKDTKRKVEPEQQEWLDKLTAAGANAGVWRPADWESGRIEDELRAIADPRLSKTAFDLSTLKRRPR